MADLKPCPFCGGTKIKMYSSYSPDLHGFAHLCEINGEDMVKVESRFFETEEEAVEVWNRGVLNVPDTNVGDIINRQAAIDALKGLPTWWADGGGYYGGAQPPMVALLDPEDAVSAIENLPSEQPERKMGKWIYNSPVTMKCDQCGFVIKDWDWHRFKFCPNCNCDMRGEQE